MRSILQYVPYVHLLLTLFPLIQCVLEMPRPFIVTILPADPSDKSILKNYVDEKSYILSHPVDLKNQRAVAFDTENLPLTDWALSENYFKLKGYLFYYKSLPVLAFSYWQKLPSPLLLGPYVGAPGEDPAPVNAYPIGDAADLPFQHLRTEMEWVGDLSEALQFVILKDDNPESAYPPQRLLYSLRLWEENSKAHSSTMVGFNQVHLPQKQFWGK
ncbi:hypothetical protein ABW19_dt0209462 [Dactylella cylindrospora]|nr:hypothetical protein ABW19_dt0209462 [Dactylella cylindrospora]